MARSRTNIEIEDDYVRAIMDRYGVHTETEAVELALRHLAGQPMTREQALAMRGAGDRRGACRRVPPRRFVILVDTSAWVEFDRATDSPADRRIADLIAEGGPLAVTDPVAMEVLAGARSDEREADLRRLLLRFVWVPFDAVVDFDAAMRIHRRCRQVGVTPRGMVDCMILAVAHRRTASVLPWDADFTGWRG